MRQIKATSVFFKDLKREGISPALLEVLTALATRTPIAKRYLDHPLKGNLAGLRECHIQPDLLLICELLDKDTVKLIALNSHSKLFR